MKEDKLTVEEELKRIEEARLEDAKTSVTPEQAYDAKQYINGYLHVMGLPDAPYIDDMPPENYPEDVKKAWETVLEYNIAKQASGRL